MVVDTFVEVLERGSHCQHVVVDPLLHDQTFQEKWKRPANGNFDSTKSLNALVADRNPMTSAFSPPMVINRLRASHSVPGLEPTSLRLSNGTHCVDFSPSEDEILQRSLSRVTLKDRIARKKMAASPLRGRNIGAVPSMSVVIPIGNNKQEAKRSKSTVYLAIST